MGRFLFLCCCFLLLKIWFRDLHLVDPRVAKVDISTLNMSTFTTMFPGFMYSWYRFSTLHSFLSISLHNLMDPQGSSQLSVMPVPGVLTPSYKHTCKKNTTAHKIKPNYKTHTMQLSCEGASESTKRTEREANDWQSLHSPLEVVYEKSFKLGVLWGEPQLVAFVESCGINYTTRPILNYE